MAANDASPNARQHAFSSDDVLAAHTGAMGQNESREAIQQRNADIHRGGTLAVAPSSGKLPRRSGLGSQVAAGQRRLGNNVLANASTYDFPDDEPPPRKKQVRNNPPFSPLKRQTQQQLREEEARKKQEQEQEYLDGQLLSGADGNVSAWVDQVADNRHQGSGAEMADDDAIEQDRVAVDSIDAESVVEPIQQSEAPKRNRGRPSKQKGTVVQDPNPDTPTAPTVEPIQQSSAPKRKRGRPSKAAIEEANANAPQQVGQDALQGHGSPDKSTGSAVRQSRPTTQQKPAQNTVAGSSRPRRSSRTRAPEPSMAPPASVRRTRQMPAEPVGQIVAGPSIATLRAIRAGHKQSSPRTRPQAVVDQNVEDDKQIVVTSVDDEAVVVRPEELPDLNDADSNDQDDAVGGNLDDNENGNVGEERSGDEEDEDEDEDADDTDYDDDEHVDGTEIQVEPTPADQDRLYGYWPKIREAMREVAKHRGSTVRIKDDEFKEVLQACRDAINAVRTITAGVSLEELDDTIQQCREAVTRAGSICGNGEQLEDSKDNRKRCFHIFKHLLPALARLLRAAVKAFERVNGVGTDTRQIPLDGLPVILDLLLAVVTLGENANKGYPRPSKPIKHDVHGGITIPLRELHSGLDRHYKALVGSQEQKERNEEFMRAFAAKEQRRHQQAQRRKLGLRNQDKWKRMNQVRREISKFSSNMMKINHINACPMTLVETDANGEPFLPTHLRDRRGEWSMLELDTLEEFLRKHGDTSEPLRSTVFERLMLEHCPHREILTEKNVLEIVIKANEMKNFYIRKSRERGEEVQEWVRMIPRWMDPPRNGPDAGDSVEDVIEIK